VRGIPLQRPEQFGTRTELTDEEFVERRQQNDAEVARLAAGGTAFLAERGVRSFRQTSLVVDPPDGRVPDLLTVAQEATDAQNARRGARPNSVEDRSLYDRCITRGVVGSILPVIYGNGLEVLQSPDSVAIRYEMIHEARVIPLDGRAHVDAKIRTYMGDPRGRWEGDTLVVETTNFLGRTGIGLNGNGPPTSPNKRLVERFKRVADDRIDHEVTVEDPETYTAPFRIAVRSRRSPTTKSCRTSATRATRRCATYWARRVPRSGRSRKRVRRACRSRRQPGATRLAASAATSTPRRESRPRASLVVLGCSLGL
jgi:hypothetical protein